MLTLLRQITPTLLMALPALATLSAPAFALPTVGDKPAAVTLKDDQGGRLDGSPWTSAALNGKVHVLFYVDPDEKDVNEALEAALADAKFPKEKYGSVAIINMAATWLPNAAISSSLKSKQEKYPEVTYVKDLGKNLVKTWQLKDDAYNVLAFDKQGKLLFAKDGTLAKSDIDSFVTLVRQHLDDAN